MSQSTAVPTSTGSPTAPSVDETRFHSYQLLVARAGWIALTLLILTLTALAIPKADALLQAVFGNGQTSQMAAGKLTNNKQVVNIAIVRKSSQTLTTGWSTSSAEKSTEHEIGDLHASTQSDANACLRRDLPGQTLLASIGPR
jgi:hypothetical protein